MIGIDAKMEVNEVSPMTCESQHTPRRSRKLWLYSQITREAIMTEIDISNSILLF